MSVPRPKPPVPRVLTVAGSDSGGGAGIQADLKTFTALGVFGMAAITSVTAQDTVEVARIQDLPPDFVTEQIDMVAQDIGVDAAKTGMLSSVDIVEAVADALQRRRIPNLVVDPVMVAKSGRRLLLPNALDALVTRLLPLAHLVTPNIPEAEVLSGLSIAGPKDMAEAARRILGLGGRFVAIKGGHLDAPEATDLLVGPDTLETFSTPRLATKNTHGTGCTYSSAIVAYLAKGFETVEAVRAAKEYVTGAIRHGFSLGQGRGPLNHFWKLQQGS